MEARREVLAHSEGAPSGGGGTARRAAARLAAHPGWTAAGLLSLVAVALSVVEGLTPFAQTTVNGCVSGSYFALGAVGLTLVYGILKLVNFAHGDYLTLGAYVAFVVNVSLGVPIIAAIVAAMLLTAAVGLLLELAMWRPMRARGAGIIQLLIMTIGLAFLLRNAIQLVGGVQPRSLDVNRTDSVEFLGLSVGQTELLVAVSGFAVLTLVGLVLRYTSLGQQMRALSDNLQLAEATGIDTGRIILITWVFAGSLAGLAGVLSAAAIGTMTPNLGAFLLLTLFAAVILGGIGNAYGALAGGLVLGLSQEWSTLLIDSRWKLAIGFGVLILGLVIRPQGIFGTARTV